VYVNQVEEISLKDWEYLISRTTGRAGHMPFAQMMGDCNPASPLHWIVSRKKEGDLLFLEVSHRDNPEIYDQTTGVPTPEGEKRLSRLARLTGDRKKRLFYGLWAAPEGAIYSMFDEELHKVGHFPIPALWPRMVGVDPVGAYTAAVFLALDPESWTLHVYDEYYEPFGKSTPGHVRDVLEKTKNTTIFAWVGAALAERQARMDWQVAGIPLLEPPFADVWAGIDKVSDLLNEGRIVVHDNCVNLLNEIGSYKRTEIHGIATNQIENKDSYHLLDALRYIVAWLTTPNPEGNQRIVYQPVKIGNY
jgi:phage terminase large subunit